MLVSGEALSGSRFSRSEASRPRFANAVMSAASAGVTTSARYPSSTALAPAAEPPRDCLLVTSCPVFAVQAAATARRTSR